MGNTFGLKSIFAITHDTVSISSSLDRSRNTAELNPQRDWSVRLTLLPRKEDREDFTKETDFQIEPTRRSICVRRLVIDKKKI